MEPQGLPKGTIKSLKIDRKSTLAPHGAPRLPRKVPRYHEVPTRAEKVTKIDRKSSLRPRDAARKFAMKTPLFRSHFCSSARATPGESPSGARLTTVFLHSPGQGRTASFRALHTQPSSNSWWSRPHSGSIFIPPGGDSQQNATVQRRGFVLYAPNLLPKLSSAAG